MANRYYRPVSFTLEPDVVLLFAKVSFGAAGAPTLTAASSKGFCGVAKNTISVLGDVANTSATVSNVTSFVGVYAGMAITGVAVPAATTISSFDASAGTITMSANATGTHVQEALSISGGQYKLTLGRSLSPAALDPYVKLLGIDVLWDCSGLQGSASTAASSPAAPMWFLVQDNVSSSSLANFYLQFGTLSGATLTAANPASGEIARLSVRLSKSNAP